MEIRFESRDSYPKKDTSFGDVNGLDQFGYTLS